MRDDPIQHLIARLPGVMPGEVYPPTDHLSRTFLQRGFDLWHEIGWSVYRVEVVAERFEFRQFDRDYGLAGAEVFVELDRIGRLGERRQPEWNAGDVEAIQV